MNLSAGALQLYKELENITTHKGSIITTATQTAKSMCRTSISNSEIQKGARTTLLTIGIVHATTKDILNINADLHNKVRDYKPNFGKLQREYNDILSGTKVTPVGIKALVCKKGGSAVAIKEIDKQIANIHLTTADKEKIFQLKKDIKKAGKYYFFNPQEFANKKLFRNARTLKKTFRISRNALMKQLRNNEAGSGMAIVFNTFATMRRITGSSINAIRAAGKAAVLPAKITVTTVASVMLKKNLFLENPLKRESAWKKEIKKTKAKVKKWKKITPLSPIKFAWKHTLGWTLGKIPFSNVFGRFLKMGGKGVSKITKIVLMVITLPLKLIANLLSLVSKVFAVFSTVAMGFIILCLSIMLIGVLPSLVVNIFNLNENQEANKTALFDYVQSLYQADIAQMTGSSVNMQCSNISFIDKIDETAYKRLNIKDKNNQNFRECTNLAEIISIVYAKDGDYIVKDDGLLKETAQYLKYKLEKTDDDTDLHPTNHFMDAYLLYEYTHQKSYSYVNVESSVSGNFLAEYTTYYFDEMFKLPTIGLGDGVISSKMNSSETGIYLFLRRAGLSHDGTCALMGNLWTESRWSPTADNGSHKGLAQWDIDVRYTNFLNYCSQAGFSNPDDMTAQLSFVIYELACNDIGGHSGAYSDVFKALLDPDVYNALAGCVMEYEEDKDLTYKPDDDQESIENLVGLIAEKYEGCGTQGRQDRINKAEEYKSMFDYMQYSWLDYSSGSSEGSSIVTKAEEWIGRLHYNQNSPHRTSYPLVGNEGSDCSGLVYSMLSSEGISCPACTASWQTAYMHVLNGETSTATEGFQIIKPAGFTMSDVPDEIQAGDILLYRAENGFEKGTGHVAIATGEGERVHCTNNNCGYGWRTLNSGEYAHCCAIGEDTVKDNYIWNGNETATVVIRMNAFIGTEKTSVANGWYIPVNKVTEKDTDSTETLYLFYGTLVSVANDTLEEYKDTNNSNIGILKEEYRRDN